MHLSRGVEVIITSYNGRDKNARHSTTNYYHIHTYTHTYTHAHKESIDIIIHLTIGGKSEWHFAFYQLFIASHFCTVFILFLFFYYSTLISHWSFLFCFSSSVISLPLLKRWEREGKKHTHTHTDHKTKFKPERAERQWKTRKEKQVSWRKEEKQTAGGKKQQGRERIGGEEGDKKKWSNRGDNM